MLCWLKMRKPLLFVESGLYPLASTATISTITRRGPRKERIKRNIIVSGLANALILFFMIAIANGALVTQDFYVEIDSVHIGPIHNTGPFDRDLARASYYSWGGPAVGSKFFGSVTYDDANITKIGQHKIGYPNGYWSDPSVNELQDWKIRWNGIGFIYGWMFDCAYFPWHRLYFMDKKLSGIDSVLVLGMGLGGGPDREGFSGTEYFANGSWQSYFEEPLFFEWHTHGTLHCSLGSVPEPSSMILISFGLACCGIFRTRIFQKK